jgi:hypothetical protein
LSSVSPAPGKPALNPTDIAAVARHPDRALFLRRNTVKMDLSHVPGISMIRGRRIRPTVLPHAWGLAWPRAAMTSGTWDKSILTAPDQPQTLFELFEQCESRTGQTGSQRRDQGRAVDGASLGAGRGRDDVSSEEQRPVWVSRHRCNVSGYGTTLIPTSYATIQARRNAVGSALLALERSGRLRSPNWTTRRRPILVSRRSWPGCCCHNGGYPGG